MSSPHVATRARLLRIEDGRRDEPAYLDSLLQSGDPVVRASAALTAGRIGTRAHLRGVRALALDGDTAVASNALFALALLKDTASLETAVRSLARGAGPGREAAFLLGELGEPAREPIVRALADSSLPVDARGALLLAAARLRPVPANAVAPLVASRDSAIAWRAAYVIARGRGLSGVRNLLAAGSSPWVSVREQVARAAARSLVGDSLAGSARAILARLVVDESARVRVNALRSLAGFGLEVKDAIVSALRDPDAGVRVTAAQVLEPLLGRDSVAWATAFRSDTTLAVRRALADGAIRHSFDLGRLADWSGAMDWRLRSAAADLAARAPAADAQHALTSFARDPDGRVRAAAARGLAQLADSAALRETVRQRMRMMLNDDDIGVRTAILGGLTRWAVADDFAAALTSYRRFAGDGDNDARLAFWRLADSVLARRTPLADSVATLLGQIPRPSDPIERLAAARIPRFASWRDSLGTARSLGWYEDRAREAMAATRILSIETERGVVELSLFGTEAPLTVYNVVSLAARGYFDGQRFHRVVPNFVAQAGDPRGDGNGGPGYAIRDEINRRRYGRGTLGMALSGPNTGGSQFFITHSPQPHLDGGYTVFGQLSRGGDVLDRIVQGDRIVRITVR